MTIRREGKRYVIRGRRPRVEIRLTREDLVRKDIPPPVFLKLAPGEWPEWEWPGLVKGHVIHP